MGNHSVILIFGIFSFMGWYACAVSTKKVIKEIGFHKKYYPQRYIMPNRKIRKFFKIEKRYIPKWLYYELLISFVYVILFVISTAMYLLSSNKFWVAQLFIWIYGILTCMDMLYVMIWLLKYK